ncbi:MAG: DUF2799 domain-containing protein [Pseudomonadota bacterium]
MTRPSSILRPLILAAAIGSAFLLAGCDGTMQRVADCKAGDWGGIGHKDGHAGLGQNFGERKDFCASHEGDQGGPDAAARYLAGWAQGNWDLWSETGRADGARGLPAQFEGGAASAELRQKQTPPNRSAYDAGWVVGNGDYWENAGKHDGGVGKPLAQREAQAAQAGARALRFDGAAYARGWHVGNRNYWADAGTQDARNGLAEGNLRSRAASARSAGVLVQEDAYLGAWYAEIPNYWKTLGAQDAVSGRDLAQRRAEAQRSGLKVYEAEYLQSWEARLEGWWREAGRDDGDGKPYQFERHAEQAQRRGVFVTARSREHYSAAWEAQNARYCHVDNAFALGRRSARMAFDVCRQHGQVKRAYLSGQEYEVLGAKRAKAAAEVEEANRKADELRRQLARMDRDIRASLESRERMANEETLKQDKRREGERKELAGHLERAEHQRDEARRAEEGIAQRMQRLQRDIYMN